MKTLCVLQHVEAEHLGLMEDHFEGRSIRFRYVRPFVPGGAVPTDTQGFDGLVLLGSGTLGMVSGQLVPSLGPELRLAADFLARGLPVVGIGFGSMLLAVAAGGGAEAVPLRFTLELARRIDHEALFGCLPESFPVSVYMRDRPVLPAEARILAQSEAGEPLVFQIGGNSLGLLGHPGIKVGMIEDLIMEFDECPDGSVEMLDQLRSAQGAIGAALTDIMVGMMRLTGWMETGR